ncbi:hypothetical protein CHF27_013210 [Romboutsia maritimum]|uniref:Uncharacterized protein n=1 Tax=Romboutsia maritimum TaxID=2020948 RepID=A0A371IPS9_9FIRM|nr:hypothetical protein [Romboutsia maritimum]RDY22484.1 hypothetical protein CHF27_013210 [Romboutsia maritimum]
MKICSKCDSKIGILQRFKSSFSTIQYVCCEIECDKCKTRYKVRNKKAISITRSVLYFLFIVHISASFKFSITEKFIWVTIGCCLLNPIANFIVSYFADYKEIE